MCVGAGRCVLWTAGYGLAARNLCEEFAPRNGAARVREEGGANRALEKPAGTGHRRGICVKNLLPGTKPQGFARRGEQTAPWKSRPAGLRARNSRPEVRARKPKTKGSRGVEREPCRPADPLCLPEDLQVCPAGPSHFRRTRPGRPPGPLCFPAGRAPTKKHRAAARRLLLSY